MLAASLALLGLAQSFVANPLDAGISSICVLPPRRHDHLPRARVHSAFTKTEGAATNITNEERHAAAHMHYPMTRMGVTDIETARPHPISTRALPDAQKSTIGLRSAKEEHLQELQDTTGATHPTGKANPKDTIYSSRSGDSHFQLLKQTTNIFRPYLSKTPFVRPPSYSCILSHKHLHGGDSGC